MHEKYCIKLASSYVYKVYVKYTLILYWDLGPMYKIAIISKSKRPKSEPSGPERFG